MANTAWTLCTSGAAITKAGEHADATIIDYGASRTELDTFSKECQGKICAEGHTDFVGNNSTYVAISGALSDACSSAIAMRIIGYHPTTYSLRAASLLLNLNDNIYKDNMKIIREKENQRLST